MKDSSKCTFTSVAFVILQQLSCQIKNLNPKCLQNYEMICESLIYCFVGFTRFLYRYLFEREV
jgi:hypothetical protein